MIVLGLARVVVSAVVTEAVGVVVATRGMPATLRRRRRSCDSVANIVSATVQELATSPTVVYLAIVTEFTELAVEASTSVGDRLLTVLERIIDTVLAEAASLAVPNHSMSSSGVVSGVHNGA